MPLHTRHIAIYVPVGSITGFEKFLVLATKLPAFQDVKGEYEGTELNQQYLS
jgi:hypothetical protein